jgi:hypothetical protein
VAEEELTALFHMIKGKTQQGDLPAVRDREVDRIRSPLQNLNPSAAVVPRIYIVLRLLDKIDLLDTLVQNGCTDAAFPYTSESLPDVLNAIFMDRILEAQKAVVTLGCG